MRYYVLSDIHGFFSLAKKALEKAGYFSDAVPHKLIVCGDLFDRGEEAFELQDFIVDLIQKDEVILIKGNHEDLALEFIENIDQYMDGSVRSSHHWGNGTVQTIVKLVGMDLKQVRENQKAVAESIAEKFKQTPFFKTIIPSMLNFFETERYVFVHGWIPCVTGTDEHWDTAYVKYDKDWRSAPDTEWEKARWYNGMKAAHSGVIVPNKVVVCGHYHCSYGWSKIKHEREEFPDERTKGWEKSYEPYEKPGIIAIDACTAYSGIVNCIVLEDEELKL